jgi:hypothetical protein
MKHASADDIDPRQTCQEKKIDPSKPLLTPDRKGATNAGNGGDVRFRKNVKHSFPVNRLF